MKYKKNGEFIELIIDDKYVDKTILEFFQEYYQSKKLIHQLRMNQQIDLNQQSIKQNFHTILKTGDCLKFPFFLEEPIDFIPEDIPLEIVYEDDLILIINKPPHLEVHPSDKEGVGTLVNAVAFYYQQTKQNRRIRYIHRLDRDTTGLILFVKNYFLHSYYDALLKDRLIKRFYIAIVSSQPRKKQGIINLPIGRDRHHNQRQVVSKSGQTAITHYRVLKTFSDYSLIECQLQTGRTHQIRVHMKAINCPIIGDTLYHEPSPLIKRQALHAYKITFPHAFTKELVTFEIDPPNDMKTLL